MEQRGREGGRCNLEAFVLAIGVPIWKQRGREGGRCSSGAHFGMLGQEPTLVCWDFARLGIMPGPCSPIQELNDPELDTCLAESRTLYTQGKDRRSIYG